jgi:hypothetical protein
MAESHDYEVRAFLTRVISVLERLDIPYMVVGGFAATFYGRPRLTLDVDIVVDMQWKHVRPFVAAFPGSGYHVSEESMFDSLTRRRPFHVIETATAAKVDLVPLRHDAFTRKAFERRRRAEYDAEGNATSFIAPEDLVVAKLLAYQATESDRHLRDAQEVLVMQRDDINLDLIRQSSLAVGVFDLFEMILEAAHRELKGAAESDGVE